MFIRNLKAFAALAVAIGVVVFGSGTSSERFHAALAPTELVPGAKGEAAAVHHIDVSGVHDRQAMASGKLRCGLWISPEM